MPAPPYTAATESARACASGGSSSTIWLGSSRVGASTRALGLGSFASSRSIIGAPKASVLPDPVGDLTSTSRPASTSGITAVCTGNGLCRSLLDNASATAHDTPRPAKVCEDICELLAGSLRAAYSDSGDSTDPDRRSARDKNLASGP